MKNLIIIITAALFTFQFGYGQTLKEIFLELPTGYLSTENKELMINNFLNNKKGFQYGVGEHEYYLTQYEPKNGYLMYTGAYEGSDEIVYWNMSNGNKLVAINSTSCGGACDSHLTFYEKDDAGISKLPLTEVIPEITMEDFFDVDQMKQAGITKTITNKDFSDFNPFLYSLPRIGKNITVESQTHELGNIPEELKNYDLGPKITLYWNDGHFIKEKSGL